MNERENAAQAQVGTIPSPVSGRLAALLPFMWQVPACVLLWLSMIHWPMPPTAEVDPSWQLALSDAWLQSRQFGRDIIFTWGPWAFLVNAFVLPDLVTLKVSFEFVSKLAVAAGVVALSARLDIVRRVLFLGAVWLFGAPSLDSFHPFLAVAIVTLWLLAPEAKAWQVAAAVIVLAFLSLVKFTHFVFAGASVALTASSLLATARPRRALAVGGGFLLALLAWWTAAGQSPAGLPAFVRFGLNISSGYGQAMAIEESWPVFVFGALLAALWAFWIGTWWWPRRRSAGAFAVAAVLALSVFMSWRHGFTRADGHVLIFFVFSVFLATAMPALARGETRRWPLAAVIALTLGEVWLVAPIFVQAPAWSRERLADTVGRLSGKVAWREAFEAQTQESRRLWKFPRTAEAVGDSTIDFADFGQGVIFLNRLHYRPRPIPQSYAAYTPLLLRENLAFIESDRAPQFLLLGLAAGTDYLGQVDSLLMAELPRRYEPVLIEHNHTLLRRRLEQPPPGSMALTPVLSTRVGPGEPIEIPDIPGHALWMQVRSTLSPLGRLRSILYKPPTLLLTAENETQRGTLRIVPGIAEAGFVLQPFLADDADLAAYLRGRGVRRATRVQLDAVPGQARYWSSFEVRVSRIESLPIQFPTR
jgi:hypothetical protein